MAGRTLTPWEQRELRLARLAQLEEAELADSKASSPATVEAAPDHATRAGAALDVPPAELIPEPQPEPELSREPEPEPDTLVEHGPRPRVFACSDIHVDYRENWRWVEQLSDRNFQDDALIVAGDVTDDLGKLRNTLRVLQSKFAHVFYVPGNHDLWIRAGLKSWKVAPLAPLSQTPAPPADSIAKLEQIFALCAELGVYTSPRRLRGVWIVPLLAWYHAGFDTEPDITGWAGIPPIEDALMDYQLVKFPAGMSARNGDETAAVYFDELNERLARDALRAAGADAAGSNGGTWQKLCSCIAEGRQQRGEGVISFSHFLPRIELMPEKRFLYLPTLSKAVGSGYLKKRVEQLEPDLHVFGHTHFGWDSTIDGVRYVQTSLCYPQERQQRARSISIGPNGGIAMGPVCVWSQEFGGDKADMAGSALLPLQRNAHWSAYYRQNLRTPENTTELSPWVANRYKRVGPKVRCSSCGGTGSYKGRGSCRACDSTGSIG